MKMRPMNNSVFSLEIIRHSAGVIYSITATDIYLLPVVQHAHNRAVLLLRVLFACTHRRHRRRRDIALLFIELPY